MSETNDRALICAKLRQAREYGGFSQEDVAKYLGVSRSAVSLIETGDRRLDILELKKLAQLYQCKIEELSGESTVQPESEAVRLVAKATAALSEDDKSEVLRFAQFLSSRNASKK